MSDDRYGGRHSLGNTAALAAHEAAVLGFASHRPIAAHLQSTLRSEPGFVAAHALLGFAGALSGRAHGMVSARTHAAATSDALRNAGGGTAHERALSEALSSASVGRFDHAAGQLEQHLGAHPRDLLAIKLAHALRFMTGQTRQMLESTAAVLPSWSEDLPGFGFVLGCHAFALEEGGELRAAEDAGRRAVKHEPEDVWGLHAVAHVMEMAGRTREGRAWLAAARLRWGSCGTFGQHLLWHTALFHLSDGDHDAALALYDAGIEPLRNGDFRDVANAVSLLWRLEEEGVDVGARWDLLHEIAHERRRESTYAFASLHYLLALIASGDVSAAEECVMHMRHGNDAFCDQSPVFARIGVPLGETLLSLATGDRYKPALPRLARDLGQIGGSRAQQDVFLRALISIAADERDDTTTWRLLEIRRQQRAEDRFQALIRQRISSRRQAGASHHPELLRHAS